jgi:hypothetical protein
MGKDQTSGCRYTHGLVQKDDVRPTTIRTRDPSLRIFWITVLQETCQEQTGMSVPDTRCSSTK